MHYFLSVYKLLMNQWDEKAQKGINLHADLYFFVL